MIRIKDTMCSFSEEIGKYKWNDINESIHSKTPNDVINALNNPKRGLEDFKALISPSASAFLGCMAELSRELTLKRFGKTIQLYIPLYLSNYCENQCVYCGFNSKNKIKRTVLSMEQILDEVKILKSYGYEHILLVTGESSKKAGLNYFKEVLRIIRNDFSQISMEIQPMNRSDYEELIPLGLNSIYVYQETYNRNNYNKYHLNGKKQDFEYRLHTPERLGFAGIHRIGLGILIGLEDWRTDSFFTALHLNFLKRKFWRTKFSVSFPRLRPHTGLFAPNVVMSDRELVQLICAYRLLDENLELSISVREKQSFRNNIMKLGVTSMSAGSKTNPGGYNSEEDSLAQFEVHDDRTPAEIAAMIKSNGYEAVWKDWDRCVQI